MRVLSHILVPLFILGLAGSAILVAITLTRDLADFLSDSGAEQGSNDGLN